MGTAGYLCNAKVILYGMQSPLACRYLTTTCDFYCLEWETSQLREVKEKCSSCLVRNMRQQTATLASFQAVFIYRRVEIPHSHEQFVFVFALNSGCFCNCDTLLRCLTRRKLNTQDIQQHLGTHSLFILYF